MPISSQARRPIASQADNKTRSNVPTDVLEVSRRMGDLAAGDFGRAIVKAGDQGTPEKKLVLQKFKQTAQNLALRAIQSALNLRQRHYRRRAMDCWIQAIDRKMALLRIYIHRLARTSALGKEVLLKDRVFKIWRALVVYSFSLWVRLHQVAAWKKGKRLMAFHAAWKCHTMRILRLRRLLQYRGDHWIIAKSSEVFRLWRNVVKITTGMLARTGHSYYRSQLRMFMTWRAAVADKLRGRYRTLRCAVVFKVVDMRCVSGAFSQWRRFRADFRDQVRVGVIISALVNKDLRLMMAAHFHFWKVLVRSMKNQETRIHKRMMRTRRSLLGNYMSTWMYRSLHDKTQETLQNSSLETHHLLFKKRVLQSMFRLAKRSKQSRLRYFYWKHLNSWNRWLEFVQEQQRLRLQLPYHTGEVVPKEGEMRKYRFSIFLYCPSKSMSFFGHCAKALCLLELLP